MRSSIWASILAFSCLGSAVSFINPPPPFGDTEDFSSNPVYTEGSAITVVWTDTKDTGIPFSIVVYQVDHSNGGVKIPADQDFEYVVHDSINRTESTWIVATAKDLSFSNVFVLSVFFQGDTVGRALSHWFNITSKAATKPQQTTTLPTSSSTPSSTSSTNTATSTPPPPATGSGLSTSAKIGLAAGGVAVLVLGVAVGWFWSRVRRNKQSPLATGGAGYSEPTTGLGVVSVVGGKDTPETIYHEMSSKTPCQELDGRTPRFELYGGTYPSRIV